jgi:hypothetical protein
VAGEHFPSFSRDWETLLHRRLDRVAYGAVPFRLIRADGRRAVVEVAHVHVPAVRAAWNSTPATGGEPELTTRRTWGTLVGAKAWLRRSRRAGATR